MKKIFPTKLKKGDEMRVISPSRSLAIMSEKVRETANKAFAKIGLNLTFGKHVEEIDEFDSSSIEHRVEDFHNAFYDQNVRAVITVIGGFNGNQLLRYLDWELIRNNPKVFCGFSDITAFNNAIYAKTGLVTYSGPHYSTFGDKSNFDYRLNYFKKCLFSDEPFKLRPGDNWSDDKWWMHQGEVNLMPNPGWLVVNEGEAKGTILGSNLCTFNLLQGTEFMPDLTNSILFIEDDDLAGDYSAVEFDRNLQSLIHQSNFEKVKGIVIGRFQKGSKMTDAKLLKIIKTKKELDNIPVVANVDFGHTEPKITFPIGGEALLKIGQGNSQIKIGRH